MAKCFPMTFSNSFTRHDFETHTRCNRTTLSRETRVAARFPLEKLVTSVHDKRHKTLVRNKFVRGVVWIDKEREERKRTYVKTSVAIKCVYVKKFYFIEKYTLRLSE